MKGEMNVGSGQFSSANTSWYLHSAGPWTERGDLGLLVGPRQGPWELHAGWELGEQEVPGARLQRGLRISREEFRTGCGRGEDKGYKSGWGTGGEICWSHPGTQSRLNSKDGDKTLWGSSPDEEEVSEAAVVFPQLSCCWAMQLGFPARFSRKPERHKEGSRSKPGSRELCRQPQASLGLLWILREEAGEVRVQEGAEAAPLSSWSDP